MLRLPSRIPYHIAMEAILTGEMFSAERAQSYGLVNRLVEPGQTLDAALELARVVAANGPLAVQTAKSIVTQSREWSQAEMFDLQRPRRSEERSVGKGCVSLYRSRGAPCT